MQYHSTSVSQSSAALWYRDVGMLEERLSMSERVLRGGEGGGRGSRIGAGEQAEHRAGSTSGSPAACVTIGRCPSEMSTMG